MKPRRWHLWHRDPWGAARHPYTDDERQHHHAKMELRFVILFIAMALVTVKLLAHFGG